MTNAHFDSNLSVGMIKTLPEGMYLFPLDARVNDTTDDIPVLNNLTSHSHSGKFKGAVRVEEGTTNIVTFDPTFESYADGQATPFTNQMGTGSTLVISKDMSYNGLGMSVKAINGTSSSNSRFYWVQSILLGDSVTFSAYVYSKNPNQARLKFELYGGDYTWTPFWSEYHTGTGWERLSVTVKNITSDTQLYCFPHCYDTANPVYFDNFLLEKKPFKTEFTASTRNVGQLEYDISQLGMTGKGCVAFWFYNNDFLYSMPSGNKHLINFHSNSGVTGDTVRLYISGGNFVLGTNSNGTWTTFTTLKTTDLKLNSWNHVCIQWGATGGREMYINGNKVGELSGGAPTQSLVRFTLGHHDTNSIYHVNTKFEQLILHPNKTFTAEEIATWYYSNNPFYDWRDSIFYI